MHLILKAWFVVSSDQLLKKEVLFNDLSRYYRFHIDIVYNIFLLFYIENDHLFLDAGLKSRFLNMLSFNGGVGGTPDATRNPEEPIPPDISLCLDHLWTEPISRKPRESAAKKVFLSRLVLRTELTKIYSINILKIPPSI